MISYVFEITISKENSTKTLTFKTNKHLNEAISELKGNINKNYLNRISISKNIVGIELRCVGKELSHPNIHLNNNGDIRFSTNFRTMIYGTFRKKMCEKRNNVSWVEIEEEVDNHLKTIEKKIRRKMVVSEDILTKVIKLK